MFVFDAEWNVRFVWKMNFITDIIPVKSDIKDPVLNDAFRYDLLKFLDKLIRNIHSAGLYTYDDKILKTGMVLQYLVGQSFYSDGKLLFVQDGFQAF